MKTFEEWREDQVAAFSKARDNAAEAYRIARELTNQAFWFCEIATTSAALFAARQLWSQRHDYERTLYDFYVAASEAYQAALDLATLAKYEQEVCCEK